MAYSLISENSESTVVTEYKPRYERETTYQSEAKLEEAFIKQLKTQAYDYLNIKSEEGIVSGTL